MSFWSAIVAIVAITAFANIMMARYRHRSGHHGTLGPDRADPQIPAPRQTEVERELAELKDRLAVLERIATDDRQSRSIAAEIESLRDR